MASNSPRIGLEKYKTRDRKPDSRMAGGVREIR